jgi:hypothetical protein
MADVLSPQTSVSASIPIAQDSDNQPIPKDSHPSGMVNHQVKGSMSLTNLSELNAQPVTFSVQAPSLSQDRLTKMHFDAASTDLQRRIGTLDRTLTVMTLILILSLVIQLLAPILVLFLFVGKSSS